MTAYYNEIDPFAAQTLRNLIDAGHIAHGVVDERSIEDVRPTDLRGFTQCHFFAGVGVWSYALRRSGWPDDRAVWTGSCPCQPFSAAGKGAGFADERHLWPAWLHLISECRPPSIFGEQVASKDAEPWIDLVHDDMEAVGYAFGAVPFPAAGVGAPHIRDRLYFVADTYKLARGQGRALNRGRHPGGDAQSRAGSCGGGLSGLLGNAGNERLAQRLGQSSVSRRESGSDARQAVERTGVHAGGLADLHGSGCAPGREGLPPVGYRPPSGADCGTDANGYASPTNGHWRAADWLLCRDGKWRPVEPGTFPLAHGATSRVGRLRAYGNAICAEAAVAFIESYLDA